MKKMYQFEFQEEIISNESYGHGRDDDASGESFLEGLQHAYETCNPRTGNILEWGSGVTSLFFSDLLTQKGRGFLLTIDHNESYLRAMASTLPESAPVSAVYADIVGPRESQSDTHLNYSTYALLYGREFDLIFIDGRRRVECALTAASLCHEDTLVVVHDYRRTRYQPMLQLFDLVDDGEQFRVMKAKSAVRESFAGGLILNDDQPRASCFQSLSGQSYIKKISIAPNDAIARSW